MEPHMRIHLLKYLTIYLISSQYNNGTHDGCSDDYMLRIKKLVYLCCFLWSQGISPLPSSNVCRLWRMPFHQTWQRYSRRGRSSTYHAVIILALLADWILSFHVMMRVLHCGGVRCANGGQLHKESFWQPNHIGSCFDQDQYVFFLCFVLAQ